MTTTAKLKLVPFNATWVSHDKIDIHAIYRRPRYREDEYGEHSREYDKDGLPTWDLTGPLPIKQHVKWSAKGFEYVTLANRDSLAVAAAYGTLPPDTKAADFDQHQTGGPWSYRKYVLGHEAMATQEAEQLKADVYEFGSNAVESIRKRQEPSFKLPEHLQNIAPGSTFPKAEPEPAKGKKGA